MKFDLTTAGYFYDKEGKEKLEKLGFKFEVDKEDKDRFLKTYVMENVNIEISTLEDLLNFINEYGSIVVSGETITIYDDYLE